jgi:hypothetical protein
MKRRTVLSPVFVLALAVCAVGCSGTQFTIPNTPKRAYDLDNGRTISTERSGFQLLLFFPIGVNDRHERAWHDLERAAAGDFITDVKIRDSWTWALVGTIYHTWMEATAYPYL